MWAVRRAARDRNSYMDARWFMAFVVRPYVGRVLDFLVRPGAMVESAVLLAAYCLSGLAMFVWMLPCFYLVIAVDLSRGYAAESIVFLAEMAWCVLFFVAWGSLASIGEGLGRAVGDLKFNYGSAQMADWAKRHPGESYWHDGWVYTRD